jgi:hypothetical protein
MFLLNHFEPPTKQQERWKEELNTEIVNWDLKYEIPFYCTKTPINLLFFNCKQMGSITTFFFNRLKDRNSLFSSSKSFIKNTHASHHL